MVTLKASTGRPEGILWAYSSSPVGDHGASPTPAHKLHRLVDGWPMATSRATPRLAAHNPRHRRPLSGPSSRGLRAVDFVDGLRILAIHKNLVDETWMTSQQYEAFDVHRLMFVSPHATLDP